MYSALSATVMTQSGPPEETAATAAKLQTSKHPRSSKKHVQHVLRLLEQQESAFLERSIARAENEATAIAKANKHSNHQIAITNNHKVQQRSSNLLQRSQSLGRRLANSFSHAIQRTTTSTKRVSFANKRTVRTFHKMETSVMITYDSGADGHYISEKDRITASLLVQLPFRRLSKAANTADTFNDFPNSLLSVGKLADDDTISIFTKDGVTVHDEKDVLITCKGEPILIGVRDSQGRYRIPLMQHKGQWQPRKPTKRVNAALQQANSVYDLPTIEQAIKWMHAVCGYPVKSTWLKAVKAGNFHGWPLLTEKNINKYYPETDKTIKGHLNQTRKNARSTKAKPLETAAAAAALRGKKQQDIFAAHTT
jgi:hypothetical protein